MRSHGSSILAYLLKRVSPKYISVELVHIVEEMIEISKGNHGFIIFVNN